MHFHIEVLVKASNRLSAENEARILLAQYDENSGLPLTDDFSHDWFQIGGRWRGVHVAGNTIQPPPVPCWLCHGTGKRTDNPMKPGVSVCNGCLGEGKAVAWPTQWDQHPLDVCRTHEVSPDLKAHAVLTSDRYAELPEGQTVTQFFVEQGGLEDGEWWLVTVDCHS